MAKLMKYCIIMSLLTICFTAFHASAQIADTPWPMFHHGLNHTGVSPHYGPDTPIEKWKFQTTNKIYGSAAIGDDGTIYVGTWGNNFANSRFYAINPDGTEKWHWTMNHYVDSTPAIAQDGTVYIGSWDKKLYAFNPDGTKKWEFSGFGGGYVYSSPAIAQDGTIYIGNNNNTIYAINPDGTEKWNYPTLRAVQSSPAVGEDGTIYVGSNDRKIYAINPDGTLKWTYTTGDIVMSSPAIDSNGIIYVGSNDRKLYALYPDGTIKWTFTANNWIRSSPAIDANGTIYVGSVGQILYAINPNGTLKWNYPVNGMIYSSPAIDADGTIYVGTKNGYVYAINENGTLLWNKFIGSKIFNPSPAIGSDGTIFIGNTNGDLFAIGPGIQPNVPPVLDPIGDKTINEAETLIITLSASDPNGDSLTYSCNRTDLFTDFNPTTGTGSWTTDYEDSGIYRVEFGVSDGNGGIDNETIRIEVLNVNRPPVLDPVGDKIINETEMLIITLNASDPDGDAIIYSCNRTDLFTDFNPTTGTGSWTTDYEDSGIYRVEFGVSDGNGGIDNETIRIEVLNVNRPPVLDPIGNKSINESKTLIITVNASDPDGDPLVYSTSNIPDGAIFNSTTQTFLWTPTYEQAGIYEDVQFTVSDGELIDYENITITVINIAPLISVVSKPEVAFQEQFTVNITVEPRMTEIYGIEYDLSFDNSVLHAEWQNEGMFLNHDGADTILGINTIDNDAGNISFALTRSDTSVGVTDPGTLAVIKFTAKEPGACTNLNITHVIVSDPNGEALSHVETNNSSVCVLSNLPPFAVGKSTHKYSNEGENYICKVFFNGTESYDEDGEIVNWMWSFGDGNYGTGELNDHVYLSWNWDDLNNSYEPMHVTLTVTDSGDPHQLDATHEFDVIVYTAGDTNGDGIVNILDLSRIGLNWMGSTICGAYCWEGNEDGDKADLNNDCVINILDAVIIGTCWGHTAY